MRFGAPHFHTTFKGSRAKYVWKAALIAATLSVSGYGSNSKMNRVQSVIEILGLRALPEVDLDRACPPHQGTIVVAK